MLVAVGAVLVVVGAALAWVLVRDDPGSAEPARAEVLVATDDLEPGEAGDDIVADERVELRRVTVDQISPGALRSLDELSGTILGSAVEEGGQVVGGALRSEVLRGDAFVIPEGQQAIAVTLPFTAGAAGYVGPGDRINVYRSVLPNSPGAPKSPVTRLLLTDVEVLDVSDEIVPNRAGPADGSEQTSTSSSTPVARQETERLTLLLALDATRAEELVFAATNNELWVTLVGVDDDAAGITTPGVDYDTLEEAAG